MLKLLSRKMKIFGHDHKEFFGYWAHPTSPENKVEAHGGRVPKGGSVLQPPGFLNLSGKGEKC